MKCSVIKQCLGFGGVFLAASLFLMGFTWMTNAVSVTATADFDDNNEYDGASSPLSSSLLLKSKVRKLGNTKLYGRPATSKWLTARSDCTVQVISYLQDPNAEQLAQEEEFVCELDATDTPGGYTGLTRTLGLTNEQKLKFKTMWMGGKLTPGKSKLKISGVAEGVLFNSQEIQVPPELDIMNAITLDTLFVGNIEMDQSINTNSSVFVDEGDNQILTEDRIDDGQPSLSVDNEKYGLFNRNLQSFGSHTGNKPMLVVKVTDVNGLSPDETPAVISDDVFGTLGDSVTLKSQLYACSMGRLTVIPGDNNSGRINQSVYDAPGVVSVTIDVSLTANTPGVIRNAVTKAVQKKLGVTLPGPFKNVIYVLQKCYGECGWAAYAFLNGWNSVYVGDNYKFVGVTMHEVGHNFGLQHSGGLNGKEYSDYTCLMGNPLYSDTVGRMCFNGAKSWHIGWYNDRKVVLNPKTASANNPSWSTDVTLVGVADYQNVANIPVVLKLETDTVNDFFIAFNRATGINADNKEADDEITVVLTGNNGDSASQSYLNATLLVGEQYQIAKFGGGARTCVIKFVSIDKSTSVWKAIVQLTTSGTLPPTFKPASPKPTTTLKPTSLKPTSLKPTSPKPSSSTIKPTLATLQPTSPEPTTSATYNPTNIVTNTPTSIPTVVPGVKTSIPSLKPSTSPPTTVTPTRLPTRRPTIKPTVLMRTAKPTPTA